MNRKEQGRAKVLTMLLEGRCTTQEAAASLALSERHVLRLKQAYRDEGPAGIAHGNRGRRPGHALTEHVRAQVVDLATSQYAGYNHTHLHEQLVEDYGMTLSRRSVARILRAAGIRSPKRRRPRRHHSRRERRPMAGMLYQVDGSHHDWLEGRGPRLVLIGAVDDATGEIVYARFHEHEDAQAYLLLLRETVRSRGIPLAWYSDRHGIFQRNDKEPWTLAEELAGRREPPQVARALEELGITLITANSPQAKGRVERCWGTLQDRLVKELRRAGARTRDEANAQLAAYLPRYRDRFARPPAQHGSACRPVPRGLDLDGVCSFHYVRTVANDNTVRLGKRLAQIPSGPGGRSYASCRVEVQERLDGSLVVLHDQTIIARQEPQENGLLRARKRQRGRELPADHPRQAARSMPGPPRDIAQPKAGRSARPAADHPWRGTMVTKSRTN